MSMSAIAKPARPSRPRPSRPAAPGGGASDADDADAADAGAGADANVNAGAGADADADTGANADVVPDADAESDVALALSRSQSLREAWLHRPRAPPPPIPKSWAYLAGGGCVGPSADLQSNREPPAISPRMKPTVKRKSSLFGGGRQKPTDEGTESLLAGEDYDL